MDRNAIGAPRAIGQPHVAPSRGRGSKRRKGGQPPRHRPVAPSRGRGSKLRGRGAPPRGDGSPLHGGVDRNTIRRPSSAICTSRPFTGAWIETLNLRLSLAVTCRSPLHGGVDRNCLVSYLAFHARASPLHGGVDRNSDGRHYAALQRSVAPSRGRGSKLGAPCTLNISESRPFTGAWIETSNCSVIENPPVGRPFTGAWIETARNRFAAARISGRPFTGAWIETYT